MSGPGGLTPEQRARNEEQRQRIDREVLEKDRRNLESAPRFGEGGDKGLCPKCGCTRANLSFRLQVFVDGTKAKEYLRVTCGCGYQWVERTKDDKR
jgi:hypothetical protein